MNVKEGHMTVFSLDRRFRPNGYY